MCHQALQDVVDGTGDEVKKSQSAKTMGKQLRTDATFTALINEIEGQKQRSGGYGPHPKMEALKILMLEHFVPREDSAQNPVDGLEDRPRPEDTRAMVFVTNRGCVEEIVQWLNEEGPMLKAVPFIGQGTDTHGGKGYTQKRQQEVNPPCYLLMKQGSP